LYVGDVGVGFDWKGTVGVDAVGRDGRGDDQRRQPASHAQFDEVS